MALCFSITFSLEMVTVSFIQFTFKKVFDFLQNSIKNCFQKIEQYVFFFEEKNYFVVSSGLYFKV